jgi:hypothetical protein
MARNKEKVAERKAAKVAAIKLIRDYILITLPKNEVEVDENVKKAALSLNNTVNRTNWLTKLFPETGVTRTMTEIFMETKMSIGYDMMKRMVRKWAKQGYTVTEAKGDDGQPTFTYVALDADVRKAYREEKKAIREARKAKNQ